MAELVLRFIPEYESISKVGLGPIFVAGNSILIFLLRLDELSLEFIPGSKFIFGIENGRIFGVVKFILAFQNRMVRLLRFIPAEYAFSLPGADDQSLIPVYVLRFAVPLSENDGRSESNFNIKNHSNSDTGPSLDFEAYSEVKAPLRSFCSRIKMESDVEIVDERFGPQH